MDPVVTNRTSALPGLLEAKSMLNSIKQEGERPCAAHVPLNAFLSAKRGGLCSRDGARWWHWHCLREGKRLFVPGQTEAERRSQVVQEKPRLPVLLPLLQQHRIPRGGEEWVAVGTISSFV